MQANRAFAREAHSYPYENTVEVWDNQKVIVLLRNQRRRTTCVEFYAPSARND